MSSLLTGKAKEDFYKFLTENYPINKNDAEKWFLALYNEFKNTLIIKWFDSVGVYIAVKRNCQGIKYNYWYFYITDIRGCHLNDSLEVKIENDSRTEATEQAIKRVNEIYNEM